jgi:hypothetical protein
MLRSIDWSSIDCRRSTIWCKPDDDTWGHFRGRAEPIEIEIAAREQLWPAVSLNATTATEKHALLFLTELLNEKGDSLTRNAARKACEDRVETRALGKRAFERVWPKAREAAGLSTEAPSGRKKSSR